MPTDVSTAVLVDDEGAHKESASILRMFPYMGFPYNVLGPVALLVPACVRDAGYRLFARNRGTIWKGVKKVTGLGDTHLYEYRQGVVGLPEEPLDAGWGFNEENHEKKSSRKLS